MSLNIIRLSFGDTIGFAKDGANITNMAGAAVVSKTIKPDGTTPADWAAFGTVEQGKITSSFNDEDVFAPSPGRYRRVDKFRTMETIDVELTVQEINELILQAIFQTGPITNATALPVQGGSGQVYGWLQITRNSQKDVPALIAELRVIMTVKDQTSDGKRHKPVVQFAVLYSSLNSLLSSLASA